MNGRVFVAVAAIVALAGPASAAAGSIPAKHPASRAAVHVTKLRVAPRVLCICVTIPSLPAASEVELEAAPLLGRHTYEVLEGELGMTAAEIAVLRDRGVIGSEGLGERRAVE